MTLWGAVGIAIALAIVLGLVWIYDSLFSLTAKVDQRTKRYCSDELASAYNRTYKLTLETAARFAEVWTVADCQLAILTLEQRVAALEENEKYLTAHYFPLVDRLEALEAATPSPATETSSAPTAGPAEKR
ncbi:MAG: hypothetical protein EHM35_00890 [Planctomycetaceae bacterium]|nr:MAG: hypothetical protein EHM35_00890 [Planctomycetaceae bacterium]